MYAARDKWLNSIFTRFSGRARPGKSDTTPPPHTSSLCGRCNIEIGPHVFADTSFYEVEYLPASAPGAPSWSSFVSMPHPDLVNVVNSAAAANPTFANLLHMAATGQATPDQLKTLGLLIQSLPPSSAPATAPAQSSAPGTPARFDLVLQYSETPSERWILPRCPAICERTTESTFALTLALPSTADVTASSQIVTIHLERAPPTLWDSISRWMNGTEDENRKLIEKLKEQSKRVYLDYRVPHSQIVAQLQQASGTDYTMKSIKPGPVVIPRPKRKPAQRQPKPPAAESQAKADSTASTAPSSSEGKSKRRSVGKTNQPVAKMRCLYCKQTDVPLVLGGRFCRPCVEAGKATTIQVTKAAAPHPGQHVFSVNATSAKIDKAK
ncbi:hypothetical protein C8F01DRAFT_399552 [Mycena amicta]|nr:hypothetical protein C8F01DRAFT_399552 [Mycena amicta]